MTRLQPGASTLLLASVLLVNAAAIAVRVWLRGRKRW